MSKLLSLFIILVGFTLSIEAAQGDHFMAITDSSQEDGYLDFYIDTAKPTESVTITFLSKTYHTIQYKLYEESTPNAATGWVQGSTEENTLYDLLRVQKDYNYVVTFSDVQQIGTTVSANIGYTKLDEANEDLYTFILEHITESTASSTVTYSYPYTLSVDDFSYTGTFTGTTNTDFNNDIILTDNASRTGETTPVIGINWNVSSGEITITDLESGEVINED